MKREVKNILLSLFLLIGIFGLLTTSTSKADTTIDYEKNLNYQYEDETVPSLQDDPSYVPSNQSISLPSSYNSNDYGYITSVKNQSIYGTCWSFGVTSTAESSYIKKYHKTASDVNFSELHLAYWFYNSATDPLGGTKGDSTVALGDDYLQRGGNTKFTSIALANWVSQADESTAEYKNAATYADTVSNYSDSEKTTTSFNDVAHLQNCYWLSYSDRDEIKEMIQNYGAVCTAFYYNSNYTNSSTYAAYQNNTTSTNHCISVVGWDDNYAISNFKSNCQPNNPGAWLIKNSWGANYGNNGYMWISYEDTSLKTFYVFDFESSDNYDNNYQYDGSSGYSRRSSYNNTYTSNIFTSKKDNESLKAVSFYNIENTYVDYKVDVYTNLSDASNPTSGQLVATQTGTCDMTGYYTIPLDHTVALTKGTTFSIVVTQSKANTYLSYLVDYSYSNGSWIRFTSTSEPGQSFISTNGSSWTDISANNQNLRIKAFTNDTRTSNDVESITVHYKSSWGSTNIYYWNEDNTGNVPMSWPGVSMYGEGNDWYVYNIDASSTNLIFANGSGSNQTSNLSCTNGEWWYYNNTWYSYNPETQNTITVHFLSSWGGANIYYWNTNGTGNIPLSWPGVSMTSKGNNWYTYTLDDSIKSTDLIFTYNGNQTANLSVTTGEWWYYNNTWYHYKPI